MDFVKRNLFLILCGVGAVVGIALGYTGMSAMPKVLAEMESAAGLYKNLEGLQGQPANQKAIEAEEARIRSVEEDRKRVLEKVRQLYRFEPLVPDVFPDGDAEKRLQFRKKYHEEMTRLLETIKAGGPPSAFEIETMKERIEAERIERRDFGGGPPDASAGAPRTAADVVTRFGIAEDAAARAAILKAQSLYCYAVPAADEKPPERYASFELAPGLRDTTTVDAPDLINVWRAQVWYWVQNDVASAIAAVNEETAKSLTGGAWVGNLPIKEIVSVRVSHDYTTAAGLFKVSPPGGFNPDLPSGSSDNVFTGTASNESYEVVQYVVKLVMDQRDIPLLVEKICNNSFHVLVRTAYTNVPLNKNMTGKIYGPEPVVIASLNFEFIMLGEVFRPLMAPSVCDKFNVPCPK